MTPHLLVVELQRLLYLFVRQTVLVVLRHETPACLGQFYGGTLVVYWFPASFMWLFPLIDVSTMADHQQQQYQPSSLYLIMAIFLWPSVHISTLLHWALHLGRLVPVHTAFRIPRPLASDWVPLIMGQWERLENRKRMIWGYFWWDMIQLGFVCLFVCVVVFKPQPLLSISLTTITTHSNFQKLLPLLGPPCLNVVEGPSLALFNFF